MRRMSCRPGQVTAVLVALAAGCGARVDAGDDTAGTTDAAGGDDDGDVIDAAGDGTPDAAPCVEGDVQGVDPASGTCYAATTGTRATFDAAQAACEAIGADLATIDSAATNAFLTALLGDVEAFVGGSDRLNEGAFVWIDGTPVTYTNWRSGEPNNGGDSYQEDCIVLQPQLGGVWDDRPCDSTELPPPAGTYYYVCAR